MILVNFLAICVLLGILLTSFVIEFFCLQVPCLFCFMQRLAILGVAFGLYLNLFYGCRVRHYAASLLWALLGLGIASRHIALNVCENLKSLPFYFFSYRLYTWSFLAFFSSILGISLTLFFHQEEEGRRAGKGMLILSSILFVLSFVLLLVSLLLKQKWRIWG